MGGGGLVLYYKADLDCVPMGELNFCSAHIEIIWLRLQLVDTWKIYFGLTYRPNSGNTDIFMEKLEEFILLFRSNHHCEINIVADMNLDMYDTSNKIRKYKNWLKRLGLTNIINEASHVKNMDLGFSDRSLSDN